VDSFTPQDVEHASGDRYEVQSLIGRGGMGMVYLGVNRELGSRVAIKVLHPDTTRDDQRLARFRREAALSAQLSHPNIVPVFEFQHTDDMAYLVMPYVDGVPLDQQLRRDGPLPRADVQRLIEQIGSALQYAHNKRVVHRDVKPSNILLEQESGRWMLTDFGVAHVEIEGITELTNTEATIGTLSYMAPEQLGGSKHVDGRADLYSLSLVACETLLGERPERDGPDEVAQTILTRCRGVNQSWVRALVWPLAAARDERPPSVAVWVTKLKGAAVRRRRRLAVGITAAAILLAGSWALTTLGPTTPYRNPVIAVFPFEVTSSNENTNATELDSVLTLGVTRQIQTLPGLEVINENAVRAALARRYGAGRPSHDNLLALAQSLEANEVVIAQAGVTAAGSLSVRMQVFDPESGREIAGADVVGPMDSLHALVNDAVGQTFAARLAATLSGTPAPSLPAGPQAVVAYFRGDRAFRRGALDEAIDQFDRVIEADPDFPPARLKRAVALIFRARPTAAGAEIRSALELAAAERAGLDPVSQRLLDAMIALMGDGDIVRGDRILRNIVGEHPDAIDARFLLGALQARFPTVMHASLEEARRNIREVTLRDPSFGFAHAVLLQIAGMLNDTPGIRSAIRGYLAIDSTSPRADMVRFADTLLLRPDQAFRATSSFPSRPPLVIENIATAAGVFDPPGGTRPVAIGATEALLGSAVTPHERAIAARMRFVTFIGSGEITQARNFVADAPRRGVPRDEVDRWVVLCEATPLPSVADAADVARAVRRLRTTSDDVLLSRWLVARWARHNDTGSVRAADAAFQEAVNRLPIESATAHAFRMDLAALDRLPADTAGAIDAWNQATSRYALDQAMYGLVGSWWPMHLDRILVTAAQGDLETTRNLVAHFRFLTGFADQLAWYHAFGALADLARVRGETALARTTNQEILRNLSVGTAWRDSVQSEI
jgi:serine/threonine protein kinase